MNSDEMRSILAPQTHPSYPVPWAVAEARDGRVVVACDAGHWVAEAPTAEAARAIVTAVNEWLVYAEPAASTVDLATDHAGEWIRAVAAVRQAWRARRANGHGDGRITDPAEMPIGPELAGALQALERLGLADQAAS